MPLHRRHGMRTVTLTGEEPTGRRQATHLLDGRKTVLVRPLRGADGSAAPLERPGELVLALNAAGRSVAVLRVVRVGITSLADVDLALVRADDPDARDHVTWSAARRAEWLAAGLRVDDGAAVVWVRFAVVGREQVPGDGAGAVVLLRDAVADDVPAIVALLDEAGTVDPHLGRADRGHRQLALDTGDLTLAETVADQGPRFWTSRTPDPRTGE